MFREPFNYSRIRNTPSLGYYYFFSLGRGYITGENSRMRVYTTSIKCRKYGLSNFISFNNFYIILQNKYR